MTPEDALAYVKRTLGIRPTARLLGLRWHASVQQWTRVPKREYAEKISKRLLGRPTVEELYPEDK